MITNYKIIVCPNITIGETIVNYIVEVYENRFVGGIMARGGGYHEYPAHKLAKTPSKTIILTAEGVEKLLKQYSNASVERW